ncbi:hypothetical protein K0O13_08185 [Mammaliicoccus sciuri]|uniref:hypothetical protein n=1 Tax=Mammaliicoccus sciuri TaxID=1296 RepID=UPI001C6315D8|nr:hypothetical protein [Mammaliicoccus sciuri]QYG30079.1 hypothetical protein K0O13_08185 [Mammaliicoccus sciuri]
MVKIKTKKEMNLPELIDWIWKNEVGDKRFISDCCNSKVFVSKYGKITTACGIGKTDTFTVEVEEEITEDTVIPKIAELNLCGYDQHEELFMNENKSIKQLLNEVETNNKAFYIMNDDMTMTLIWTRDKGLVE